MTYCVGLCLKDGLVFLSDTRTNAGVDQISSFRKMTLFQKNNDRFFTLMSAGNLAITQAVKEILLQGQFLNGRNLWNVTNAHDAAVVVGDAIKKVYDRDYKALEKAGIDFNCNLIFGGQIKGERPVTVDESNPYFKMIHQLWGEKLREAFNSIAEPSWSGAHKASAISTPAKKMGAVPINHQPRIIIAKKVGAHIAKKSSAATKNLLKK